LGLIGCGVIWVITWVDEHERHVGQGGGQQQRQGRIRRQWRQHEGPHGFPGGAGDLETPGGVAPHGAPGANLET
jgi:hypothetical protein